METKIYYFTGTGNCLTIAKRISSALDNASVLSIAQTNESDIQSAAIGIVSPIYMYDMPHIVVEFIKKIRRTDYLFFVFAGGGEPGNGLKKVRRLCYKQGLPLSALYDIVMPSNYSPYGYPDEKEQKSLFDAANEKISAIADTVSKNKKHFDNSRTGSFRSFIHPGILYKLGHSQISRMDNGFSCDESCSSCGLCQRICPVNNISMQNGRPQWHNHCEQCFACFNWCPEKAIQYRNSSKAIKRYHHPDVMISDIIFTSR